MDKICVLDFGAQVHALCGIVEAIFFAATNHAMMDPWIPVLKDVVSRMRDFPTKEMELRSRFDGRASTLSDELTDVDTVLVGPEGGFTEGELGAVTRRVALSGNVLRVETAALTAAILLTQRHERT